MSNIEPTPFGDKYVLVEHIATGGMADVLAGETTTIQSVEPDLTLQGLRIIWRRSVEC